MVGSLVSFWDEKIEKMRCCSAEQRHFLFSVSIPPIISFIFHSLCPVFLIILQTDCRYSPEASPPFAFQCSRRCEVCDQSLTSMWVSEEGWRRGGPCLPGSGVCTQFFNPVPGFLASPRTFTFSLQI